MIEINGVNKKFSNTDALNNVIAAVQEKSIFGLVGTNGAGKSTLLRIMCGVICPDTGSVMVDGENVYENPKVKGRICFLSDEAYFFPNATGKAWQNITRSSIPILTSTASLISWSAFSWTGDGNSLLFPKE